MLVHDLAPLEVSMEEVNYRPFLVCSDVNELLLTSDLCQLSEHCIFLLSRFREPGDEKTSIMISEITLLLVAIAAVVGIVRELKQGKKIPSLSLSFSSATSL